MLADRLDCFFIDDLWVPTDVNTDAATKNELDNAWAVARHMGKGVRAHKRLVEVELRERRARI